MKFTREDITKVDADYVRVMYYTHRTNPKEPFWDEIIGDDWIVIRADKEGVQIELMGYKISDPLDITDFNNVMQQAFWHYTCLRDGNKLMRSGEPDCVVQHKTDTR